MKAFCVHPFLSRKRSLPYEIMQMINLAGKQSLALFRVS